MQIITFGAEDLANRFATLSEDELDNISFGVIQVDATGRILLFNDVEAGISGRSKKAAVGKNFFTEVAICTNESGFRGKFDEGVRSGNLDVLFEWHMAGDDRPMVQVHLKKAARGNNYWIFVKRL
jgi:photoactive yellow protein